MSEDETIRDHRLLDLITSITSITGTTMTVPQSRHALLAERRKWQKEAQRKVKARRKERVAYINLLKGNVRLMRED
jgi:hypothetical protein